MNFSVSSSPTLDFATPCLVLPVWSGEKPAGAVAQLDHRLGGLITEVIEADGYKASLGDTRLLYTGDTLAAPRVLLLGLGKREKFSLAALRKASLKAARAVRQLKKEAFAISLPEAEATAEELALAVAEGIVLGLHVYDDLKSGDDKFAVAATTLLVSPEQTEAVQKGVDLAQILTEANLRARALVNRPSNLKTPEYMAEAARKIAAEKGLAVDVWDENRIQEEKMGALWGVGMGSDAPPRFIVLEYAPKGTEDQAPIALVGKGMTFDTGGYSLKPSTSMEDMKDDMAGSAVVLAAMSALADLGIQRRVLGIVASAENMVSGRSQRPGDIVTARNGKTIEVLNTDAEGRLILADALTYASEQNPALIVDFATLTGAIGITLGKEAAGIFTNDEDLAGALIKSGHNVGERLWPLPMWDEYKEYVKGSISDLKNISGERGAGSIVGAVFLENFVGEGIPWAHLDIAAVSLVRDDRLLTQRGATGFGVRLILDYLRAA